MKCNDHIKIELPSCGGNSADTESEIRNRGVVSSCDLEYSSKFL